MGLPQGCFFIIFCVSFFVLKMEISLDTIHGIHPNKENFEHEL